MPKQPHRDRIEGKARTQVAAVPLCLDHDGRLRVLLETSRDTGRFIVPKGWTEKGKKDREVAAVEAKEEAGLVGSVSRKPIGKFTSWKRLSDHFVRVNVKVYLLEAKRQLPVWREKDQRKAAWFLIEDAMSLLDDPGLVTVLQQLPTLKPKVRPVILFPGDAKAKGSRTRQG